MNGPTPVNDGGVAVDLIAVVVAVDAESEPKVLTLDRGRALPSGPFQLSHRSLQSGLRDWVEQQTHHPLGYVEQLYTFADRDRGGPGGRAVSISYLGLTREAEPRGATEASWRSWYTFFPWEDHRGGVPALLTATILPALAGWADAGGPTCGERQRRVAFTFGTGGVWNEELVLQRYELMFDAGLVAERTRGTPAPPKSPGFGREMILDHRRILATGIARLRAKIKYRPVVFELMPARFTLLELQRSVEAIAGRRVHKQNFRRLVEQQQLVEETGETSLASGGRPAKLFRFRRDVLAERAVGGTKLPPTRG